MIEMRAVQRTAWQSATVMGIIEETATAKTFRLALSGVSEHLAGQHFIVALSAPDGYRAQRAYSVASAPDGTENIELTVERLGNGEVSSFLHHEVVIGDTLQVRGPIGGWFVWRADCPALLVGGGSGIVPLMSIACWSPLMAQTISTTPRNCRDQRQQSSIRVKCQSAASGRPVGSRRVT